MNLSELGTNFSSFQIHMLLIKHPGGCGGGNMWCLNQNEAHHLVEKREARGVPDPRMNTGHQLHLRQQASPVGLLGEVHNHILPIGTERCTKNRGEKLK